jgi:GNAT superfamily N-acetyltransferase
MLEMHAWRDALITISAGRLHCFLAHLLRLGPEERLERFWHRADDGWLRAYVGGLDLAQRKIIGCFEGEQMRGAAELSALGAAPSRLVEAAFSVEKDWCGQGVERALIVRAITTARSMGARQLFLDRLGPREALRRAVAQFDADVVFGDDDCRAWLALTPI